MNTLASGIVEYCSSRHFGLHGHVSNAVPFNKVSHGTKVRARIRDKQCLLTAGSCRSVLGSSNEQLNVPQYFKVVVSSWLCPLCMRLFQKDLVEFFNVPKRLIEQ
jgi:hypothetical protein